MSKQCQSCGMPLRNKHGDHRATEKDGSKSEKWCNLCYKDGKFIDADITLVKMTKIVDEALTRQHWPKPLRWLAKRQLPKLDRWKQS